MPLKRKFGFKETTEDRKKRAEDEKKEKWRKRLQKENVEKLQMEHKSLCVASFLSPPQKERKRLVERMIRDLSTKADRADDVLLTSNGAAIEKMNTTDVVPAPLTYANFAQCSPHDIFVPRSLRRTNVDDGDIQRSTREAERQILDAKGDDDFDFLFK